MNSLSTDCLSSIEANYHSAKARLQAAQQEKLEAADEFLAARAALRQTLEALWPSPCECGRLGYQGDAGGLRKNPAATEEAEIGYNGLSKKISGRKP